MARTYERLPIEQFGKHLLTTGDLDPIYIALKRVDFGEEAHLHRWLIAYWCFYSAGFASWASDAQGSEFWTRMRTAAKNEELTPFGERWPRGHERRHFRGEAATKACRTLAGKYLHNPEQLVTDIIAAPEDGTLINGEWSLPFASVAKRAQELPLFGPWISFKIGDMLERVLDIPVVFDNENIFMFDDPTQAALWQWRLRAGFLHYNKAELKNSGRRNVMPKDQNGAIKQVVDYLIAHFSGMGAPPEGDRPVGLQEVETILCKWKSHMNGHYPLNNDIDEITDGVRPWIPHSKTAKAFAEEMPRRA